MKRKACRNKIFCWVFYYILAVVQIYSRVTYHLTATSSTTPCWCACVPPPIYVRWFGTTSVRAGSSHRMTSSGHKLRDRDTCYCKYSKVIWPSIQCHPQSTRWQSFCRPALSIPRSCQYLVLLILISKYIWPGPLTFHVTNYLGYISTPLDCIHFFLFKLLGISVGCAVK